MVSGSSSKPGYINFLDSSGNRAAYIGWADGNNHIQMLADTYLGFNMKGNFLLNQINYPATNASQLGYQLAKTSTAKITSTLKAIVSVITEVNGVYMVEGQCKVHYSDNPSGTTFVLLSLSTINSSNSGCLQEWRITTSGDSYIRITGIFNNILGNISSINLIAQSWGTNPNSTASRLQYTRIG